MLLREPERVCGVSVVTEVGVTITNIQSYNYKNIKFPEYLVLVKCPSTNDL